MKKNNNKVTAVQIIPAPTNLYNNNKKKLIESYKKIITYTNWRNGKKTLKFFYVN